MSIIRRGAGSRDRLRHFLARNLFHSLQGMTFGDWRRLLARHRFAIDPAHWPRVFFQTGISLGNEFTAWKDRRDHGGRVAATEISPPLIILGHWRSGTTHLHNLLDLDPGLASPNFYQALNPLTFLASEAMMGGLTRSLTMSRRPQDNVALGVDMPTEDEFALCAMTGLSPYMGWAFPRDQDQYAPYLTFRDATEEERARWRAALTLFAKKLTIRYGRPLVLKSPPHTARIKLLLETFPDARFVHIRRNPYSVFRSTKHLMESVGPYFRLQSGGCLDSDDRIIATYSEMHDAFFEQRGLIPPGHFCEIGYEDLVRDPVEMVGSIYRTLGLPGFDDLRPRIEAYLASLAGYEKNRHVEMPEALRERIAREWGRCFDEWGYPTRSADPTGPPP